jgi:zinc protease
VREIFSMWSAPSAVDAPACVALLLEMLADWCKSGITADELEFCRSYIRRSYAFEIDTPRKRVGQGIERELLELPEDFHSRFVERVDAVTLEQANEAVRRRIDPRGLWLSVVGAAEALEPQLRAAVPDLAAVVVVPHDAE